eukprot:4668947-Heterocapsa_arctica.AAC.1
MEDSTSRAKQAAEDLAPIASRKILEDYGKAIALKSAARTFVELVRNIETNPSLLLRCRPRPGIDRP